MVSFQGIEGPNNRIACFVIFWGAQNIAGESSLKIPYGTKAVNMPVTVTVPSSSPKFHCTAFFLLNTTVSNTDWIGILTITRATILHDSVLFCYIVY